MGDPDFDLLIPTTWPQPWRRIFLLGLPVTVPLYCIAVTLAVILFVVFFTVFSLFDVAQSWARQMWTDDPHGEER